MKYILIEPTEEQEIQLAMELLKEPGRVIRNVRIIPVEGSDLERGIVEGPDGRRQIVITIAEDKPRRRRKTKQLPPDVDSGDTKTKN